MGEGDTTRQGRLYQEGANRDPPMDAACARGGAPSPVAHAISVRDDIADVAAGVAMDQPLVGLRGDIVPRAQWPTSLGVHAHNRAALPISILVAELALQINLPAYAESF